MRVSLKHNTRLLAEPLYHVLSTMKRSSSASSLSNSESGVSSLRRWLIHSYLRSFLELKPVDSAIFSLTALFLATSDHADSSALYHSD